jgi:hypothetical protein
VVNFREPENVVSRPLPNSRTEWMIMITDDR